MRERKNSLEEGGFLLGRGSRGDTGGVRGRVRGGITSEGKVVMREIEPSR